MGAKMLPTPPAASSVQDSYGICIRYMLHTLGERVKILRSRAGYSKIGSLDLH